MSSDNPIGPDGHPGSRPAVSHVAQIGYMIAITGLATIVVTATYSISFNRSAPLTFWGVEVVLIAILAFVGFYDYLEMAAQAIGKRRKPLPTAFRKGWKSWRDDWAGRVIALGVVTNMAALWQAVDHSGGGVHSPFAPLLAGPAIFGASVAQTRKSMALVIGFSAAVIVAVDATSKHSVPQIGWGPYVGSALALLLGAGFINIVQIEE